MLLDRLTNKKVSERDIPSPFIAARYRLLEETRINGHTTLEAGYILAEDGSEKIKLGDTSFKCAKNEVEDQQLVELALLQIMELIDFDKIHLPSPLLPSQLFDAEGDLNELESLLAEVIDKGHLHEISRRPRFDMRYDELVLPVSRAKRLAGSAERHLAAHSECWQRRTLTGIQPRKIMGMVSEDEYNLYENRVYVRLLDRFDRFLAKRIREIEALTKNLTDALELDSSEQINYRLSRKLYSIWGETFTDDSAAMEALDRLEKTQNTLKMQHQSIRGLIQHKFYRSIPKSAQIPSQVEQTNILSHDQHYRHLPKLWNTLRKENHRDNLLPEEMLETNIKRQDAYISYCGNIILRALKELGYEFEDYSVGHFNLSRTSSSITVNSDGSSWEVINDQTGYIIKLIPILSWHSEGLVSFSEGNTLNIPCCLQTDSLPFHPADWLSGDYTGPMLLSPLDFYVEERVISLFSMWLLKQTAQDYGQNINLVPSSVMKIMAASNAFEEISSKSSRLVFLPSPDEISELREALVKENAKSSLANLNTNYDVLKSLERCPCCQTRGTFIARDNRCFVAECKNQDCNVKWSVSPKGESRVINLSTADQSKLSFIENGRWWAAIQIS